MLGRSIKNMSLPVYITARVIQSDLAFADKYFTDHGINDMSGVEALKGALLSLTNFLDFERSQRSRYQEHPILSETVKPYKGGLEFAKYLRNKYVGHIKPELVEKAIEWKFELRLDWEKMDSSEYMFWTNLFLLETAINSYVKKHEDGNYEHKLFSSETDLMYPPDMGRFICFLEDTIKPSLTYLDLLISSLHNDLKEQEANQPHIFELAKTAGKTQFKFITK